jgi:threonine aldolase
MRFVSAQLEALLESDLWLASGARSNALATHLAESLKAINSIEIVAPVETNMVFARLSVEKAQKMRAAGALFHDWIPAKDGKVTVRLALAFATPEEDVAKLIELAKS